MLLKWLQITYWLLILHWSESISKHELVFIVSFDGFGHDYISKGHTPIIEKLRNEGTTTHHMINTFPTITYPNHWTLATGVYPDKHQVLSNSLYDSELGEELNNLDAELYNGNHEYKPIWITNELHGKGRYSGVIGWPGIDHEFDGQSPTYNIGNIEIGFYTFKERIDAALEWMQDPDEPANLVLIYFQEPDATGHIYGIDTDEFNSSMKSCDEAVFYLLQRLDEIYIRNRTNIFLLSDHGMMNVPTENYVSLDVDPSLFSYYDGSPVLLTYPEKGKANKFSKEVRKLPEYGKQFELIEVNKYPKRWHFNTKHRTPPFLLMNKPGYIFDEYKIVNVEVSAAYGIPLPTKTKYNGVHGYDNTVPSMWPFFVASGPRIKKNNTIEPFNSVDLYKVWCTILGFPKAGEKTDGNSHTIKAILKK